MREVQPFVCDTLDVRVHLTQVCHTYGLAESGISQRSIKLSSLSVVHSHQTVLAPPTLKNAHACSQVPTERRRERHRKVTHAW